MNANALTRYLIYSCLTHLVLIVILLLSSLSKATSTQYFAVDFISGISQTAARGSQLDLQKIQKKTAPQSAPDQAARFEEDLLVPEPEKTVEEAAVEEKEEIAAIPTPEDSQDGSAQDQEETVSEIPSAANQSGIGIGFGSSDMEGSGGGGTGNFPYTWYVYAMRKKLDANWNIKATAGQRIYSQVAFTISKDGSVKNAEIEQTSGNSVFDRAALRAIENSAPFPPLPDEYTDPELRVHIRFSLKM